MWPRCVAARAVLGPATGTRGFRQVSAKKKVATSKKGPDASGRDPFALFKSAIIAEPDAEVLAKLPAGHREEHEAAKGERSRRMMAQHKRVNGHSARLIRMREQERRTRHRTHAPSAAEPRAAPCPSQATAALPAELQDAARQPDLAVFPAHRRVFTDTCDPPRHDSATARACGAPILAGTDVTRVFAHAPRPPIADFEKKMRSRRGGVD